MHYRGYDVLDFANRCEFEEIAHLLVHGKLPNVAELTAYKAKLKALRGIPAALKASLEQLPPSAHPMDVMRTAVSVLGCVSPEKEDHNHPGARDIADKLMASLGSALLYWYHFSHNGKRIDVETDDDSIGGHFLHLLHGEKPRESWVRAMHTSLNLYAEHEFNASTFTSRVIAGTGSDMFSCIAGAIGALRGPKHGGANEVAFEIQKRYDNPDEAEADIRARVEKKEVVIGFGHPVYTVSDPRNKVIKDVARELSAEQNNTKMFDIAERLESTMWDIKKMFPESQLRRSRGSQVRAAQGSPMTMNSMMNSQFRKPLPGTQLDFFDTRVAVDAIAPGAYAKLPYTSRVLAEQLVRRCEPDALTDSLKQLIERKRDLDFPWYPARVVCHDILGQTALVDLAGLRDAIAEKGGDPSKVNPVVPTQLIVDHSLAVEAPGFDPDAFTKNRAIEDRRNEDRFHFIEWTKTAFKNVDVIPAGNGIMHQINLEKMSPVIQARGGVAFPDTCVGTDSHTPHVDALGVIAIGVGGLEAETVMLGLPSMMRLPDIVGVRLVGKRQPGITATDIVLAITEFLRKERVVGAWVEFFGEGADSLTIGDRATISNMCPEYGATASMFYIDQQTIDYLKLTGREPEQVALVENYAKTTGLWADALVTAEYERVLEFDLSTVVRNMAGPSNPHRRLPPAAPTPPTRAMWSPLAWWRKRPMPWAWYASRGSRPRLPRAPRSPSCTWKTPACCRSWSSSASASSVTPAPRATACLAHWIR